MFENPVVAGEDILDGFRVGALGGETVADVDDGCVSAQRQGNKGLVVWPIVAFR